MRNVRRRLCGFDLGGPMTNLCGEDRQLILKRFTSKALRWCLWSKTLADGRRRWGIESAVAERDGCVLLRPFIWLLVSPDPGPERSLYN